MYTRNKKQTAGFCGMQTAESPDMASSGQYTWCGHLKYKQHPKKIFTYRYLSVYYLCHGAFVCMHTLSFSSYLAK